MVKVKRVYASFSTKDGYRILVDRLWPRGIKKSELKMDEWVKELAPSPALRKWFSHRADRWKEFQIQYGRELKNPESLQKLRELAKQSQNSTLTLLYAAKDEMYNHAVVLKSFIEKAL